MSSKRIITQIETQKRNQQRKSIFLDGEFAFGLDEELFFKFGLHEGDEVDEEELRNIISAEEKKSARDRALRFLSYRARSEKEIRDKLADVGTDSATIDAVVADLKATHFIDDKAFALAYVHDKMTLHPVGPLLIRNELKKHRISDEIIEYAIEEAFRETTPYQVALDLAQKRCQTLKNIEWTKARKRLADFLARRGFAWEVVYEVLQQLEVEID